MTAIMRQTFLLLAVPLVGICPAIAQQLPPVTTEHGLVQDAIDKDLTVYPEC